MGEHGREADQPSIVVDGGGLNRRDLVPAEALAHNVEPAREWGIAKGPLALSRLRSGNGRGERLLGIEEFQLRFGEGARNRPDGLTAVLHGIAPWRGRRS